MDSKVCKEQELSNAGSMTTLLSSPANNNLDINPAAKVSLDLCVCLWHKLGKHTRRKRITQNKGCALRGTEFVIALSLQATGCKTSKKSSQVLTSVIPNLVQLSAPLTYVQELIID